MALLDIRNLSINYNTPQGPVQAVDNVSLTVEQAQHQGIIGESGCGKTTLIRALVRVLPRNGEVVAGEIRYKGRNILELSNHDMRELRWREIATVPQASMDSLDPVQRVGHQLETIMRVRGGYDARAAKRRAVDLFDLVGLDTERLAHYPHEFSGGMKQRAVIAMALALKPGLLIGDEPLTALDVIVQHQVLEVFRRLEEELDLTVMLVTHDISVVAQVCDTIAVMYAGRLVEQCSAETFFQAPNHPYSLGLQQAFPTLVRPKEVLVSIEGYPPDLHEPPHHCRFAQRCPFAQTDCYTTDPILQEAAPGHLAACLRASEMQILRQQALEPLTWQDTEAARQYAQNGGSPKRTIHSERSTQPAEPFIEVKKLSKRYQVGGGLAGVVRGQKPQTVYALSDISFTLKRGESLGLAGESGCGKSTTGRLLVRLDPSAGHILFDGHDMSTLSKSEMKDFRRRVQLMFQNPFEALNPRFTLYRSLSEPLLIHGWKDERARMECILETLDQVNLRPAEAFLDNYPAFRWTVAACGAGAGAGAASRFPGRRRTGIHAGCIGSRRDSEHHEAAHEGNGTYDGLHFTRSVAASIHL